MLTCMVYHRDSSQLRAKSARRVDKSCRDRPLNPRVCVEPTSKQQQSHPRLAPTPGHTIDPKHNIQAAQHSHSNKSGNRKEAPKKTTTNPSRDFGQCLARKPAPERHLRGAQSRTLLAPMPSAEMPEDLCSPVLQKSFDRSSDDKNVESQPPQPQQLHVLDSNLRTTLIASCLTRTQRNSARKRAAIEVCALPGNRVCIRESHSICSSTVIEAMTHSSRARKAD